MQVDEVKMKVIQSFWVYLLVPVSIVVAIIFLVSAYSGYLSPDIHPVVPCLGLLFPFFLLANGLMLCLWLVVKRKMALFHVFVFVLGWSPATDYCPLHFGTGAQGNRNIKVLSYNVMGLGSANKKDGKTSLDYILAADADIVCLQEFPVNNFKVQKKLKKFPHRKVVQVSMGNSVMLCSKYPIVSAKKITFGDSFNGACLFKVKIDSKTVSVLNVHLESNKLNEDDKKAYKGLLEHPSDTKLRIEGKHLLSKYAKAAVLRAEQAQCLAEIIDQNRKEPMIVCGDFNDTPLSSAHRILSENLTDAYCVRGCGPGFSYNQSFMYFRIDHILVNQYFEVTDCKVDRSVDDSDHYPIWCKLKYIINK